MAKKTNTDNEPCVVTHFFSYTEYDGPPPHGQVEVWTGLVLVDSERQGKVIADALQAQFSPGFSHSFACEKQSSLKPHHWLKLAAEAAEYEEHLERDPENGSWGIGEKQAPAEAVFAQRLWKFQQRHQAAHDAKNGKAKPTTKPRPSRTGKRDATWAVEYERGLADGAWDNESGFAATKKEERTMVCKALKRARENWLVEYDAGLDDGAWTSEADFALTKKVDPAIMDSVLVKARATRSSV